MSKYILSLNCGSSSLKFNLFKLEINNTLEPFIEGMVEEIGNIKSSRLKYSFKEDKLTINTEILNHSKALELIFKEFKKYKIENSEICAVGHRVVHGGSKYGSSVKIDRNVVNTIRELFPIAPLHNPANLNGIEEAMKLLKGVPQVAVFDTAFHAGIPEYAYRYAIPEEWYKDFGVRKYGFHGTSHMYVSRRAAKILGVPLKEFNCITAHMGNGCSITKIRGGKSIDTSMGFTPLQGVIMGTRSGDIDPALISHVVDNKVKKTGQSKDKAFETVMKALNKESGLKALGGTNMMQLIREKALEGDEEADMIVSIYAYRAAQYIGAYWASLPETQAIVFTAGLGENEGYVRMKILSFLENAAFEVYDEKNALRRKEVVIASNGKTKVVVIPTDEEIVIGYDTLYLGYLGQELPEKYPFEL